MSSGYSYVSDNGKISETYIRTALKDVETKIHNKIFKSDMIYEDYEPNTNNFFSSSKSFSKRISEDIGEDIAERTITTYSLYNTIRSIDNKFNVFAFTKYNDKLTQNEKLLISTDMLVFKTKHFDVIYDKRRGVDAEEVKATLNTLNKLIGVADITIYVNNGITDDDCFKYHHLSEYHLSTISSLTLYVQHPCQIDSAYLLAVCEYNDVFVPTFHE